MLLVLVIPHEWGHMTVARWCGVKIKEFSVGMGPLIFKREKGDTQYSLRALPLGGYCAMEGEEETVDSPTSYSSKTNPQKIAILLAGVTMNVIIAVIAVAIALWISGFVTNSIGSVMEGLPAEAAGLQAGDTIISINGTETSTWDDVVNGIDAAKEGEALEVEYIRGGETGTVSVVPVYNEEADDYVIGITAGVTRDFWKSIKYAPATTWGLGMSMLEGFKTLFTGGASADDVAGPVGLVRVVDQAVEYGAGTYLMLLALVSLNLALFNLIPIPGLDGGKIFFILLKVISRGKINDDMEYKATVAGMVVLLALFILITMNDVRNLFG